MNTDHTPNPTTGSATRPTLRRRALLGVLGLTFALAVVVPATASAANVFTLDTNPAAGAVAAVAVDSAGTGYFAWEHNSGGNADVAMFCKVARGGTCPNPITLPTPPVGFGGATQVDAAFPVLGSGSTVYVVGPRFIAQDVVVWTSTDGGITFTATATSQSGTSEGSDPTDVLAAPSGGFYISSHNPGLDFTGVPASVMGQAPVTDLTPAGSSPGDSTLGLAGGGTTGNPVEAFTNAISGQPSAINFRSAAGDPNTASNWTAASQVTTGELPSLAGGPSGLFLASQDTDASGHYTQVNVRKYTGSGFGAPLTLQSDTSGDNAGRIFQTVGGRVLVAWPAPTRADGVTPIRLYDSTNGGTFTRVGNVAEGTPFNAIYPASIRAAAAADGLGFITYQEYGSGKSFLRVADFTPIVTVASVSVGVAGVRSVSGNILINASFNTSGTVVMTSQVTNAIIFVGGKAASASAASNRCKNGQALVTVGNKKKCVSNSFGTTSKRIPAPGTYKIKLAPNTAARKVLKQGKGCTSS